MAKVTIITALFILLHATGHVSGQECYSTAPAGFGAGSKGGAGGEVLWVTTLEDNNEPGSLRWAVNRTFPRIIRFKVNGIITLTESLDIIHPYITIDGKDPMIAGGPGITIRDYPIDVRTHDVILKFFRIRLGDVAVRKRLKENGRDRPLGSGDLDCLNIHHSENVLVDHLSLSWSCDEIISATNSKNITIQWCILAEPLSNPVLHPYGDNHGYCANNSASTITYHHNLFAHYVIRGPQFEANDIEPLVLPDPRFEAINNLCYGFSKSGSRYSGAYDKPEAYRDRNISVAFQFVANKYLNTASPARSEIECIDNYGYSAPIKVFLKDNVGLHNEESREDQETLVFMDGKAHHRITEVPYRQFRSQISDTLLFTAPTPVIPEDPDLAEEKILQEAGCSIRRDRHDLRVISDVNAFKPPAVISSQEEVGAW